MIGARRKPFNWLSRRWSLPAALLVGALLALLPLPLAAALLVAVPLLLLILAEPLVGVGLALLAGPWGAVESLYLNTGPLDSGQLLFLLAVGAWLLQGLASRSLRLAPLPLLGPLGLFIGVALLSLLDASSPLLGAIELVKWLEIGVLIWLVWDRVAEQEPNGRVRIRTGRFWLIVTFLLAGAASQAAIGVWQFVLRGDGPDHFLIREGLYRASGTFQQPNPFGGFMYMGALFAAGVTLGLLTLLYDRWRHRRDRVLTPWLGGMTLAAGGVTALLVGGVLSSWSRGAWLGFAAGAAAMLFFWPRRRWQGILLALGGVAALGLAWQLGLIPPALADRLVGWTADLRLGDVRGVDITDANFAVIERLAHWQAAVAMAREQIWLGVGFGNYEAAYPQVALLNWPNALGHAHNYYLNLLAEVGFVGLVAYLLFWGVVLLQTIRAVARQSWPWRGMALGLLGVWTALAVHHMLDKLYVNNLYLYLGVLLGLLQLEALSTASMDARISSERAGRADA